jgi:hypothetical protein
VLAEVVDRLERLKTVIVRGDPAGALLPARLKRVAWDDLAREPAQPVAVQPWDLMGILYTSGTTGPSKGVRVTHAHAYGYAAPAVLGRALADDVSLVTLPLFHIGGQWAGVYNSLIAGGSSVVLPRFSATTYWDDVRRHGCTYTLLLGAMANFLFQQPPREDDARHPMRHLLMVPLIPQMDEFKRRFGIESIATAYGLTEGSTVLIAPPGQARPGAVGIPRRDFDVRLVDEHDVEVPSGKVGELLIHARSLDHHGRLPRHARGDGVGVAQPVAAHRRRVSGRARRPVRVRRPDQGRDAAPRRERLQLRGREGAHGAPCGAGGGGRRGAERRHRGRHPGLRRLRPGMALDASALLEFPGRAPALLHGPEVCRLPRRVAQDADRESDEAGAARSRRQRHLPRPAGGAEKGKGPR